MKTAFTIIALCALSTVATAQNSTETRPAWLPSTIGLHIASHHVHAAPGGRIRNDANLGASFGWDIAKTATLGFSLNHQIVIGGFKNSFFDQSWYAGIDTTTEPIQTPVGGFAASLSLGAISGYTRKTANYKGQPVPAGQRIVERCTNKGCKQVLVKPVILPAIVPSIDWTPPIKSAPTLRLSYLHGTEKASSVIHLSARWSF